MESKTEQMSTLHSDTKPRPRMVDYEIHNFCATCRIKYPKHILRCSECHYRVRTTGWHRSKKIDMKRI